MKLNFWGTFSLTFLEDDFPYVIKEVRGNCMFSFELKMCHFHVSLRYNPIVNDTGISLKCYFKHSDANELSILASVLKQSFEKTAQIS